MKYHRVVITCGVSMFGGGNAFRRWTEDQNLLTFPSGSSFPNPQPQTGQTEADTLNELKRRLSYPGALEGAITDHKRISAEYSALHALKEEHKLGDRPQVVLIHTDTLGGRAAVAILKVLLERDFQASVELAECSVNVDNREQLRYNLGDFMHKVASALRDHDTNTTCFFPLGGYKVMTSLGCLAGGYFGFPTLYLHEEKQVFHVIPGIPWKLSQEVLVDLAPTMKRIGNGCEFSCLEDNQRTHIEEYSWLFERADDLVSVNAFGLFLMQEKPALFGTKVLVCREVDEAYGKDARRRFIEKQLGVLIAKLAAGSSEPDLKHELTSDLPANDHWHLYKGASNGEQVFRTIYRYDADGNTLTVRRVWTNHDEYEAEFKDAWARQLGETVEWPCHER